MPHETIPSLGRLPAGKRSGRNTLQALVVGDGQDGWMLPDEPFHAAGCTVVRADGFEEAAGKCAEAPPEIVFMPLTLDGKPTMLQLRRCLSGRPAPVAVVIASNEQINAAAEAMRDGAFDCLFKPFSQARLARTIEGAIRQLRQTPPGAAPTLRQSHAPASDHAPGPRSAAAARHDLAARHLQELHLDRRGFVAASPQMQAVLSQAVAVARSEATVFITGEVGTGKTTLARIVHDLSLRAAAPFVTLDCGAMTTESFDTVVAGPEGTFARARGGTLFLDEIGDLAPEVQPMLLRLLEKGPSGRLPGNVRIIASTGRDLRPAMRERQLRADLFYRLHVAPLALPPLRAREGDLALIARSRLAAISEAEGRGFVGFSDLAMSRLAGYHWPGNLRELINAIWTIVLMNEGPLVTPDLLPAEIRDLPRGGPAKGGGSRRHVHEARVAPVEGQMQRGGLDAVVGRTLADIEKAVIEATIRAEGGSVPRAARVLDVSPSTLYRKRETWAKHDKG